ncbi:Protein of unknown function [Gryllus bimaculatus]|nr:Protein of unknown function [Gryllus bimaculatus]
MATLGRWSLNVLRKPVISTCSRRTIVTVKNNNKFRVVSTICACAVGGGLAYYITKRAMKMNAVHAFKPKKLD